VSITDIFVFATEKFMSIKFLARNAKDKVLFIDERRIYMGIALFYSIFI
jgi:hypothetical protein